MLGRTAKLELVFSEREGKTFISQQFTSSPFKIWRPFEIGDGRVLVQIINVSPGVMAGDSYEMTIVIEKNAKVVVVNQSATKLHLMPNHGATQNIKIQVASHAELEYYPGLTIPFPQACFEQHVSVSLAAHAKFAMLERYTVGRVERGEIHQYQRVASQVHIMREGKAIYADGLELNKGVGLLDEHSYVANGVWCWGEYPKLASSTSRNMILVVGQTTNGVGYLRGLAQDGLELKTCLDETIRTWRKEQGMNEVVFSRFMS